MPPAIACRVCRGQLMPARPAGGVRGAPLDLAPTCHRPGAHAELERCHECGTVQQPSLPRGRALRDLYRRSRDDHYLEEEEGRRRTARRLLHLLGPVAPGARLLEVGCGPGLLLDEARKSGFDVLGLEPSSHAAAHARDRLGLAVREEALEEAQLGGGFDAVVMADVLEHLDDPVDAIDRCAALLAPDGALLIATPDPASATARLARGRWWAYLPAHACLLPRVTLRELVAATGLVLTHDGPLVRSFSTGYWAAGLAERGGPRGSALAALARRLPRRPLLSLSLGDERVVVARRAPVLAPARPRGADRGGPVKVHVVLPAFDARLTVGRVAEALPAAAADRALLVDDASRDGTSEAALAAGLEVVRHPVNRGYGANQKTCYVRAALDGADVVVMVHADNQYDPALVADMAAPIAAGEADVVIGSRLLTDRAISGGMPRWKWVGNRALTWVENRGFRRRYSEYHTGYRAFSVDFLRSIPFLRNSDDFVFDQEIFAQVIAAGARVVELSIPTRYFLEASSVSFRASVVYGLKTLVVLARFRADGRRQSWPLLRRPAARLAASAAPRGAAPADIMAR